MASQLSAASPLFTIEEATIAQLQSAMSDGILTAVDLVNYYIARIERFNDALNAVISINPKALEVAAELDEARSKDSICGPLHGIPIVVKDNIDTVDMPTTGGCAALANSQPTKDAFVVAQLKEAGAIILGKANLHELACSGESVSSLGGQVRNPYNLGHTPGGSSGGTAVAIAANLAACGLGTDAVNSVRSPASACNVVGLRPTSGRVSRSGLMSVTLTQDVIGPMGRSVSDVATLLDVISLDDADDPMTARSAGHPVGQLGSDSSTGYQHWLEADGLAGKRLGIIPSLWGQKPVHSAVNKVVSEAISTMESLGAQVVELAVNVDIDQMFAELSLNVLEGKLHLDQYFESLGESAPIESLESLLKVGKGTDKVHASVVPMLEKMDAIDTPLGLDDYWQRLYPRRAELRQLLAHLFQRYQIDALVYPHQRQLVSRIGEPQKERNGFLAAACGFPAIAFPAGFAQAAGGDLPIGVELMAQPFEEGKLLQMAYAFEQKVNLRRSPDLSVIETLDVAELEKTERETQARIIMEKESAEQALDSLISKKPAPKKQKNKSETKPIEAVASDQELAESSESKKPSAKKKPKPKTKRSKSKDAQSAEE